MARPCGYESSDERGGIYPGLEQSKDIIARAQGQLIILTRQLQSICQTIYPRTDTFQAFGDDIRNLLIIACTEVETHWRGVLEANGAIPHNKMLTTNDYSKLASAMKLPEFSVSFRFYPWLSPIKPFGKWGSTNSPTAELEWYQAYHQVKHDREANFEKATLGNAFHAVTACAVMLWAQFGEPDGFGLRIELRNFFRLAAVPKWEPSQFYVFQSGANANRWSAKPYNFGERAGTVGARTAKRPHC